MGNVPGQKGEVTYGICCNFDGKGGFDYIAGVEISKLDDLPEIPLGRGPAPAIRVFEHKGSLDTCRRPSSTSGTLVAQSGHQADAPEFERYSEDFNPKRNTGKLEIWLPIKA
jgi:AraC family transcriptional regulator